MQRRIPGDLPEHLVEVEGGDVTLFRDIHDGDVLGVVLVDVVYAGFDGDLFFRVSAVIYQVFVQLHQEGIRQNGIVVGGKHGVVEDALEDAAPQLEDRAASIHLDGAAKVLHNGVPERKGGSKKGYVDQIPGFRILRQPIAVGAGAFNEEDIPRILLDFAVVDLHHAAARQSALEYAQIPRPVADVAVPAIGLFVLLGVFFMADGLDQRVGNLQKLIHNVEIVGTIIQTQKILHFQNPSPFYDKPYFIIVSKFVRDCKSYIGSN